MGTLLHARGVPMDDCFERYNLLRPALVGEIHRAYVAAGADIIETNTFGANRLKLAEWGLDDQVEAINRAGVELALAAVREVDATLASRVTSTSPLRLDRSASAFSLTDGSGRRKPAPSTPSRSPPSPSPEPTPSSSKPSPT